MFSLIGQNWHMIRMGCPGVSKMFYVVIGASALILVGCQSPPSPNSTPTPSVNETTYDNASTITTARVGISYRYNLLTHCGFEFLRFNGKVWKTVTHIGDGMGNPPPDWPNPFALGVVTLVSASELILTFPGKPSVRYQLQS